MTKIKVGDKVRVLDGSKASNYVGGWISTMNKFVGHEYSVCRVLSDHRVYLATDDYVPYTFDTRYLVKVGSATDSRSHDLVKKVIVNNPATIIIWSDETKTVVKCGENDTFDPEKGIAMAIVKKLMFDGKTTQMNKWFNEHLPKEEEEEDDMTQFDLDEFLRKHVI